MPIDDVLVENAIAREQALQSSIVDLDLSLLNTLNNTKYELLDEIAKIYGKYGQDNNLSMLEVKKIMQMQEAKNWQKKISQFLKKEYKADVLSSFTLETLATKHKLTRLEALLGDCIVVMSTMHKGSNEKFSNKLKEVFGEEYYRSLFDLNKYAEMGIINKINPDYIKQVLSLPWSGADYKERLLNNNSALCDSLKNALVNNIIRGTPYQTLAKDIADKFNIAHRKIYTLVKTEMNYAFNQGRLKAMDEADLKKYRFVAVLDNRTSEACQNHDSKVYFTNEAVTGENYPPLHPNCRSVTVPYFGKLSLMRDRVARDRNNKSIRVPANMNYEDWKKVYIDKTMTLDEWLKVNAGKKPIKIQPKPKEKPTPPPAPPKKQPINNQNKYDYTKPIDIKPLYSNYEKLEYKKNGKLLTKKEFFENANRVLLDELGFIKIRDKLNTLDTRLMAENINRLNELEARYNIIKGFGELEFGKTKKYIACVTFNFENLKNAYLLVRNKYFKDYATMVKMNRKHVETNWFVPAESKYFAVSTITHEYGHLVQDFIIDEKLKEVIKSYGKELPPYLVLQRVYYEEADKHRDEIEKIAKEIAEARGIEYNRDKYMSRYGKTNSVEFFAEAFSNIHCGKPNIIGEATYIWLERRFKL